MRSSATFFETNLFETLIAPKCPNVSLLSVNKATRSRLLGMLRGDHSDQVEKPEYTAHMSQVQADVDVDVDVSWSGMWLVQAALSAISCKTEYDHNKYALAVQKACRATTELRCPNALQQVIAYTHECDDFFTVLWEEEVVNKSTPKSSEWSSDTAIPQQLPAGWSGAVVAALKAVSDADDLLVPEYLRSGNDLGTHPASADASNVEERRALARLLLRAAAQPPEQWDDKWDIGDSNDDLGHTTGLPLFVWKCLVMMGAKRRFGCDELSIRVLRFLIDEEYDLRKHVWSAYTNYDAYDMYTPGHMVFGNALEEAAQLGHAPECRAIMAAADQAPEVQEIDYDQEVLYAAEAARRAGFPTLADDIEQDWQ